MTEDEKTLRQRAERQGIQTEHEDAFGKKVQVSEKTVRHLLNVLGEPSDSDVIASGRRRRCFTMRDLGQSRLWGLSVQLYGLKSRRNWGIGDFTDLGDLAEIMAARGAALIGVNPLHALFPAAPGHCSPYSPSSRQFLNPLYIDPEVVPEWPDVEAALKAEPDFSRNLETARASALIDYPLVASLKRRALETLFQAFDSDVKAANADRRSAFAAYIEQGGTDLARFATFEALHEYAGQKKLGWSWRDWPDGLDDPTSEAVRRFAEQHRERIRFSQFQQWLAEEQLGQAQVLAKAAGMPIGIYRDLAVAVDPSGAAAWSHQGAIATGVNVGAPPDQFNPLGQNWGLAPFSPSVLLAEDLGPLRADIEANMRQTGALRIDHVMGLTRLFWIPEGAPPEEGAYVTYPLDRLLRMVAASSVERQCLVIGEDLGTVAPGFREKMRAAGLMSYRLLYFEQQKSGALIPPARYPRNALVSISTHDLPTLQGFWQGRDLDWRDRLDLHASDDERQTALDDRKRDREHLRQALDKAGMPIGAEPDPSALALAAHRYLAGTASHLLMVQLEDLLLEVEQANLPGTVDEHPNWRRRLPAMIETLADHHLLNEIAGIMKTSGRAFND